MMEMSEECAADLTEKTLEFIKDIEAVCKKHGLQLAVSSDDNFQIWPLKDGDSCLYAPYIEDIAGLESGA